VTRADLIGGIGITIFGLLLIFWIIPRETEEGMYYGLPPTFFPTVMTGCLTAAAVGLAVQAWLRGRTGVKGAPSPLSGWNFLMFLIAAAIAVAGVIAIDRFGIVYGGPALIAAFMIFLGDRSPVRIVLTSILPLAAVWVLALHVLGAPLP
jgi:hypothetical protein